MVCFLSVWYSCKCVKNAFFKFLLCFFGVFYSCLFGFGGRFSVGWGPFGPTSPNPSFFGVCVFVVFVFVLMFCLFWLLLICFWWCLLECFWCVVPFCFFVIVCSCLFVLDFL